MKPKPLREMTLVKVRPEFADDYAAAPFADDQPLVYLGEIRNMPEHGVFAGQRSGRIYSGYHVFAFVELTEDEV